jgi:hypothetical protein
MADLADPDLKTLLYAKAYVNDGWRRKKEFSDAEYRWSMLATAVYWRELYLDAGTRSERASDVTTD